MENLKHYTIDKQDGVGGGGEQKQGIHQRKKHREEPTFNYLVLP